MGYDDAREVEEFVVVGDCIDDVGPFLVKTEVSCRPLVDRSSGLHAWAGLPVLRVFN
jgi:hypothetical protein